MSKQIDEKVVSMQFDNSHFEKNVQTSMSTLDKLKSSLKMDGAAKGLDSINAAAKGFDSSPLTTGVDAIRSKFSALEGIALGALMNIGNSAMEAGKKLVSAFTIDPVKAGFAEYELKMGSIQTIMASTGESLETVNGYLGELNEYSDKTIYSFSDMTTNIGKFTNAGVKLEDAVLAIKGISNEAAVSGANANEASRAMYNFAQALSAGYVKLIDWKSIENANMATVEFKQQLIDSALAVGTLTETTDGYVTSSGTVITATKNFNDSLQDQWMSTEVLVSTLKDYADETTEIGKKAYASAQDVKTFSMMMDTLKEAAGSGWSETFELIIGDFEESKTLWTELADTFGGLISKSAEMRNNLIGGALGSKWDQLVKQINDAGIATNDFTEKLKETASEHGIALDELIEKEGSLANVIKSGQLSKDIIIETLKKFVGIETEASEATSEVTGKIEDLNEAVLKVIRGDYGVGADRIAALTEAGYDAVKVQELVNLIWERNGHTWDDCSLSAEELETAITNLSDEELKSIGYTEEQISAMRELAEQAEKTGTPINELISSLEKPTGRELLVDSLRNILDTLKLVGTAIGGAWRAIFDPITSDDVYSGIEVFHSLTEAVKDFVSNTHNVLQLRKTFEGLFAALDIIRTIVSGALGVAFRIFIKILDILDLNVLDLTGSIGEAIVKFRDWLLESGPLAEWLDTFVDKCANAVIAVRDWIKAFFEMPKVQNFISNFRDSVSSLFTKLRDYFSGGGTVISEFISRIKALDSITFADILGILKDFKDNVLGYFFAPLIEKFESLTKKFKETFPQLVEYLSGGITKISEFIGRIKEMDSFSFSDIINLFKDFKDNVIGYFTDVGTSFDEVKEKISEFAKGISDKLGISGEKFDYIKEKIEGFIELVRDKIPAAISIGMGVLLIQSISKVSDVIGGLSDGISGLLGALSKISNSISGFIRAAAFKNTTEGIRNLAISILIIAGAIAVLTLLDQDKMWSAIEAILYLSLALVALSLAMNLLGGTGSLDISKNGLSKSTNPILEFAIAIAMLAAVMAIVADLSPGDIAKGLAVIAALEILVVGLVGVSKLAGKSADKAGDMILKIGAALLILAVVIKITASMNPEDVVKGILTIAALEVLVIVLIAVSKLAGEHADKAGDMMLKISAALLIMVYVIKLAAGLSQNELEKGLAAIVSLELMIFALIAVSKLAGEHADKIGSMMLKIGIALIIMVATIKLAAGLSQDELEKGLTVIGYLELMIIALIAVSELSGENAAKAGAMVLIVAGAILILTGVIYLIKDIETADLYKAVGAIVIMGLMFTALIAATKNAQNCIGTLIVLTVAVGLLCAALYMLSDLDQADLQNASLSLSLVIGVFALLIASTKLIDTENWGKKLIIIGAMTLVVAALAFILYKLSELEMGSSLEVAAAISLLLISLAASCVILSKADASVTTALPAAYAMAGIVAVLALILLAMTKLEVGPTLEVATSLSILLLALSAACLILSKVGILAAGATAGAASMLGLLGIVAAIILAVGTIVALIPGSSEFLDVVIEVLEKLGYALGSFFGGIVGGISAGVMSGLPSIGQSLGDFMTNAQSFFDGIKSINQEAVDGVKSLAEVMLILAGAKLVETLTSWRSETSSVDQFATNLPILGAGIKAFGESVKGVDTESITKSADAALSLSKLVDNLPSRDGLLQRIICHKDTLAEFSSGLELFGDGLAKYGEKIAGVDVQAIIDSVPAGQALSDLANTLPSRDGLLQRIMGHKDTLAEFSSGLELFGDGLAKYGEKITGVDIQAIIDSVPAGQALSDLANTLPSRDGLLQRIMGHKDTLAEFSSGLELFGDGLAKYGEKIKGVDIQAIVDSVPAGQALSDLSNTLPAHEGWLQKIIGDKDTLAEFGSGLESFGEGLAKYGEKITGVDIQAIVDSVPAGQALSDLANTLPTSGTWQEIFGGKNLEDFGGQLVLFGEALKAYSDSVVNIDISQITSSVSIAGDFVDIWKDLPEFEIGAKNLGDLGSTMIDFGECLTDYYDAISDVDIATITSSLSVLRTLKSIIPNLPEVNTELLTNFGDGFVSLGERIAEYSDEIADLNVGNVTSSVQAISSLSSIVKTLPNTDSAIVIQFGQSIASLGAQLLVYYNSVRGINTAALSRANTEISNLVNLISSMSGLNASGVSAFTQGIAELGTISVEGLVKNFVNGAPKVTSAVVNMLNYVLRAVTSYGPKIANAFTAMMNSCINAIKKVALSFNSAGLQLTSNLQNGIMKGMRNVASSFNTPLNTVLSSIKGKYNAFYDAGKNLAQGLANGISANTYAVQAKAKAMAQAAETAAKKELDSHSPSRVFEEIGEYVPEGFAIGIGKIGNLIKKSASSMAKTAVSTTSKALLTIGNSVNSDLNVQPTISPVVDLSSIDAKTVTLNAKLDMSLTKPIDSLSEIVAAAQSEINASNREVISAIKGLREDLNQFYTDDEKEIGLYVDGKKLASSLAKPMNRQLNILSKRGAY